MADVEMEEKTAADVETERKKALLVYKSNLQSASDDDASDEEDEEMDSAPVKSNETPKDEDMGHAEDDVDDEEEGGVQVEKDDEESLNAPSDDDLDSTATPRRSETDEDEDEVSRGTPSPKAVSPQVDDKVKKKTTPYETDSASETATNRAPSPSPSNTSTQHVDDSTTLTLKSGTTSNVGAIIAARRRTVARKECEVCHDPRNGRRALLCSQCKCMYHTSCFRQQFPKLTHGSNRQWFCPECEPVTKGTVDSEKQPSSTPRKRGDSFKGRNSRGAKSTGGPTRGKGDNDEKSMAGGAAGGSSVSALELQRVKDVAIHGGKKINATILEQSGEMLQITQTLTKEIDNIMGPLWLVTPAIAEQEVLLRRVHAGLGSLKQLLEQLQVAGIQFEVDVIKEIETIPSHGDRKLPSGSGGSTRKSQSAVASGSSGRSLSGSKGKSGASRLYSSTQIQKLEEWYQRSSRPESSEIQAMYRIINCPEYADPELQPEGISVKQIRIWFDNRRAKERLDYMRLKMKDISTTDMDADSVKKMKAAYIDEAKEVLEARVSRLRENGQGPSGASKTSNGSSNASKDATGNLKPASTIASSNPKKRIRIDYVASVRKAVKDARDAGKSEEEVKALRTVAIERARERLHVPYKNARTGPSKPLGKEEVTHMKLKMLKLLEEDAPAEELTDIVELLLSLIIPRAVLIDSGFQRQLELILIAHQDNKELVRQTKKLQEEFKTIVEHGDAPSVVAAMAGEINSGKKRKEKSRSLLLSVDTESLPGTPGSSPSSGPTPSPDSRRPRVKFSLPQLIKLEKYFHKEDTPSKKRLDKIAARLNGIASLDPNSDDAQRRIDYKQIRCWFYKRRSANQPPQALSAADLHSEDVSSTSSSDTESDTNDENSSKSGKLRAKQKLKAPAAPMPATIALKRKMPPGNENSDAKRIKIETANASAVPSSEAKSNEDPGLTGGIHAGRIFNMKQLATIIEEYEKNPRPSVTRLEELQKVLNQGDHADEHSANALGVTKQQIKTWFSNRRTKERLDLIKMKSTETRGGVDRNDDSEDEREKKPRLDEAMGDQDIADNQLKQEANSVKANSSGKPTLAVKDGAGGIKE
ncbi:hypothetical protein JM18_007201 [Phytophthora kernoviae]|uniref:Homeobox and zinc-finger domain-containing protein n=2 Tax=Phytophthora kernoviae TaxID=325452 RepID=A0A8T0LQ80_9STRA|nr:hypothetical protein G195_008662 [Phytophthora kernoviae 00238/432]KAG2517146.1 hypothetical protein JM16_007510 [Phytophthora kernoviae]KAG2519733.1 hypothetical protein JM18_007201 [Phytophthora kernoviae]